jgi:hypothetical protein
MVTIIKQGATKKSIEEKLSKMKPKKSFNAKKHTGVIVLIEKPLTIQERLRNEWN